jgi:hypothetical protein
VPDGTIADAGMMEADECRRDWVRLRASNDLTGRPDPNDGEAETSCAPRHRAVGLPKRRTRAKPGHADTRIMDAQLNAAVVLGELHETDRRL